MVLILGPLFSGKREYAQKALGLRGEDFSSTFPCPHPAVYEAQALAAGLTDSQCRALADALSCKTAVLCTEVGEGVVPTDPQERQAREAAGRLTTLLAQRAVRVVRVWYGLPQVLKDAEKAP